MDNSVLKLADCPTVLPDDLCALVVEFGRLWANSPNRPRIASGVIERWSSLLDQWVNETDLPLFVRKSSSVRGSVVLHKATNREIVFCDNSPAHWSYMTASQGHCPSLSEIKSTVRNSIPVVMIHKVADKASAKFNCSLTSNFNLNKRRWKLAHIQPVGLRTKKPISELSIELIKTHFKLLLSPANMFVVPLAWAGIAEAQQVVDAIAEADRTT